MKIDGRKTYTGAIVTIVYAALGMYLGHLEPGIGIPLILGSLQVMGLRHGVAKSKR